MKMTNPAVSPGLVPTAGCLSLRVGTFMTDFDKDRDDFLEDTSHRQLWRDVYSTRVGGFEIQY